MSTLPAQLSATAPAFIPTPAKTKSKTTRLVQHKRAQQVTPGEQTQPALFGADAIWAARTPAGAGWRPSPQAAPPSPALLAQPPISYAHMLSAHPSRTLAAKAGLICPTTLPDGRWQEAAAQEILVTSRTQALIESLGEVSALRLMMTAKVLLPQAPEPQAVLHALDIVAGVWAAHRQAFVTLCYRLAADTANGYGRLRMAESLQHQPLEATFGADALLNRVYALAGVRPLAPKEHLRLCEGLCSLGRAVDVIDEKVATTHSIDKRVWPEVLQQWLCMTPDTWVAHLHTCITQAETQALAQRLIVNACVASSMCLPPALKPAVAADLAAGRLQPKAAQRALETTAALLSKTPSDADTLHVWRIVRDRDSAEQSRLVALARAIGAKAGVNAGASSIERLAALPLQTCVDVLPALQALCAAARPQIEPAVMLALLAGLSRHPEQAAQIVSSCEEQDFDADDLGALRMRLLKLAPDAWLGEVQDSLLAAQEFVSVSMQDVPSATICTRREMANRQFRVFPSFG